MKRADSLTVTLVSRQANGAGNLLLRLQSPTAEALPEFSPGAHIDVLIPGLGARQYSLCSARTQRRYYEICVRLEPDSRGGSRWLHQQLQPGDALEICAPRNHFPLPDAPRTLLFAAGIGLTPLLVMAESLAARSADFELHLYLRNRHQLAFGERLQRLGTQVIQHYSSEGNGLRQHCPETLLRWQNSVIVACGPDGFMRHLQQLSASHGWRANQFHSERFRFAADKQIAAGESFEVEIASSGARYRVGEDESIAGVLMREGIQIELSCEQGICGACLTGVLAGLPDHRDEVLSRQEKAANDCIALCCSRAVSPLLVLDL